MRAYDKQYGVLTEAHVLILQGQIDREEPVGIHPDPDSPQSIRKRIHMTLPKDVVTFDEHGGEIEIPDEWTLADKYLNKTKPGSRAASVALRKWHRERIERCKSWSK